MAQSFVTKEELEMVQREQSRLEIRVGVVEEKLTSLTADVADLAESVNARFDAVDARFDAVDARFERLEKLVIDGNTALMSAILNLGKR